MHRRNFLAAAFAAPSALAKVLANEYVTIAESPDPAKAYLGSPGITRLPGGRLVATYSQTGGNGMIVTSDDHGRTWQRRSRLPLTHARPFVAGDALYVLGHVGDLQIMRSSDDAVTWSEPAKLTEGQAWHQAPCNVVHTRGRVYLVMERITDPKAYYQSVLAPVLMAGRTDADLRSRDNWVFSTELTFRQAYEQAGPARLIGVPFYGIGHTWKGPVKGRVQRRMNPLSWLETNVVQFRDPNHIWYDATGRTFHLWARAHTGSTNLACIAKAVESEDGRSIEVSLEKAPSGEPVLYVPCPGGQMKFHILYDDRTSLYWLLSSQSTDSMTRIDRLAFERFDLPNNERHRLQLHFSRNCIDWCFAGLVCDSGRPDQARHYASMVIDSDDLHVLSRSGDARAKNAHDGNLITFHTVRRFRDLIY